MPLLTGYFRREIESYYEGTVSEEFRTSAVSFTEALLSGDMRKANISLDDLFRGFVALGEPGSEDSGGSCWHEFMERVLSATGSDISNLRFGNGSGPAVKLLKGNPCGDRGTSCADQLAIAVEQALKQGA